MICRSLKMLIFSSYVCTIILLLINITGIRNTFIILIALFYICLSITFLQVPIKTISISKHRFTLVTNMFLFHMNRLLMAGQVSLGFVFFSTCGTWVCHTVMHIGDVYRKVLLVAVTVLAATTTKLFFLQI